MEAGSWFHSLGPEVQNARSVMLHSALDCVLGMYSLKELADLRPGRVVLRQSSSDRYQGPVPCMHLNTIDNSLN